ncbi:MAG: NADH:ubiquinone reductase (Na(+)-transporting) subunit B [Candidatus Cloacimonadota bacterium]|nr:MAG: NADH:ubiquinone reductase (Na(+)-transporting) subunit B [Candidatus Cloacimonadota bacterium]
MKSLYNFIQKFSSLFGKGGKLESLYPIYEMGEGFLFVLPQKTKTGAHIRDSIDMKRFMITAYIAMVPAFFFGIFNAGYQHFLSLGQSATILTILLKGLLIVLPIYLIVLVVGGVWEVLFAVLRKHEINEGFLISSFLIPLIVPPTIPFWQLIAATTFGIVIGKEIFGGVGMNIFNPALVARAFLFFSFPRSISGNSVWTVFGEKTIDTYTAATPLAVVSDTVTNSGGIIQILADKGYTWFNMFLGTIPGSIGETSTLAILLGLLLLLITKTASWRIVISVIAGGFVMTTILNLIAPDSSHIFALPFHYHFVMGGFAFGTAFMATDPVSSSSTRQGKYFYGFLIGAVAILVRTVNPAYPEGMMLAILLMNTFAPLIDHFVVQKNKKRRLKYASQ